MPMRLYALILSKLNLKIYLRSHLYKNLLYHYSIRNLSLKNNGQILNISMFLKNLSIMSIHYFSLAWESYVLSQMEQLRIGMISQLYFVSFDWLTEHKKGLPLPTICRYSKVFHTLVTIPYLPATAPQQVPAAPWTDKLYKSKGR